MLQESYKKFQNSECNCKGAAPLNDTDKKEENILDDFPVTSIEKLEEVENKIASSKDYESKIITRLSLIGGHKVDQIVKSILTRVFSDKVTVTFNWLRKKNKQAFSELRLAKIILQSIRKTVSGTAFSDKDIIDSIKNWLRHAKARSENKKK
ncbi:hypothetical protein FQA39_LY09738 [Lamprigera yunnana]|nr:hypothetical protein FQA39_LY09738 [Lamprigera yunnana]